MSALWALAAILIASGLAKLQSPQETAATFTRLDVPAKLSHPTLVKAFPFLEILLGIALLLPFTVLRPLFALAAVALFIAFTWLVVRAKDTGASCGCFGAASARPISAWTVLRNVILVVLALLGLFESVITLAVLGVRMAWWPLAGFFQGYVEWSILITVLVTAAAYLIGRETAPLEAAPATATAAAPATDAPHAGEQTSAADPDGEPERHPIPDVVLGTGQGFERLQDMASRQAILLLHLSAGCGSCRQVMDYLQGRDHQIGPVAVRALKPTYQTDSLTPTDLGPLPKDVVLTDPAGKAARELGIERYPSAVLIGTDGLTAGGPVVGSEEVIAFIEEVRQIMAEAGRLDLPAEDVPAQGPTA
jgi:hypothetical protein